MFEKIKSTFFTKIIFSYIKEEIKLRLVKYNKSIKKIIDINIINYKLFKGKYIIPESEGKGKEYDSYTDELLFEGKYLNGERNGKGKEYDGQGKISFEGEYSRGRRHGFGKEFYWDGKLKFEGE